MTTTKTPRLVLAIIAWVSFFALAWLMIFDFVLQDLATILFLLVFLVTAAGLSDFIGGHEEGGSITEPSESPYVTEEKDPS